MGGIQPWHIILVVVVFLLLFGGKRLPDAARGLGRSLRILKSEVGAMHEEDGKAKGSAENEATAAAATPPGQIAPAPLYQPAVQVPDAAPVAAPAPAYYTQPAAPAPVVQPAPLAQPVQNQPVQNQPVENQPVQNQPVSTPPSS